MKKSTENQAIRVVGIDLGKTCFQIHAGNVQGKKELNNGSTIRTLNSGVTENSTGIRRGFCQAAQNLAAINLPERSLQGSFAIFDRVYTTKSAFQGVVPL